MSDWPPGVPAPLRPVVRVAVKLALIVAVAVYGHALVALAYKRGRLDALQDNNTAQECRRRGGVVAYVYPELPSLSLRPEVRCSSQGPIKPAVPNARELFNLSRQ